MKGKNYKKRVVAVFLIAVMVMGLIGCGSQDKASEKKHISVYLWSSALLAEYAPYIQSQLPDLELEFVVGNNDLDYYKFMAETGTLPDIITNRRFSLHDGEELKEHLLDLSETDIAASYYNTYLENYRNGDGTINWLPVCGEVDTIAANKVLFEKYNIPLPTDYDSFVQACREFEKYGICGFLSDFDYDYTCMELLQGWSISELTSLEGQMWRMDYENPTGETAGLEDKIWPGVFQRMEQFIEDAGITAEEVNFSFQDVEDKFSEGKAAMIRQTGTVISLYEDTEEVEPVLLPYFSQDGEGWLLTYPAFQIALSNNLEKDGRKDDALRVLRAMLSEEAQNILAQNKDVISYKKDVNLELREELKNLEPYVESNHLYIRLASNDFFSASRDVVQKMIKGEYNAKQAYSAFDELLRAANGAEEPKPVTIGETYSRSFTDDGSSPAVSSMAATLREMYGADVLITPAYNLCGPVSAGEYTEKMTGYMVMPNALIAGVCEEMTGRQVRELLRCLTEGDEDVIKPFNLSTLPVVSGLSIEVTEEEHGYSLKSVKSGGKEIKDDAVYKVAYLNPAGFYNFLMNRFADEEGNLLFEIQEIQTRAAWTEYMKEGHGMAEPEDYIIVK